VTRGRCYPGKVVTRQPDLTTGPYVPPTLEYIPAPGLEYEPTPLGGTPEPPAWDVLPTERTGLPADHTYPETQPDDPADDDVAEVRPRRRGHPVVWQVLIPPLVALLGVIVWIGTSGRTTAGPDPAPPPMAPAEPVQVNAGEDSWHVSIMRAAGWVGTSDWLSTRFDRYADDGTWAGMVVLTANNYTVLHMSAQEYILRTLLESGTPASFGAPQSITAGAFPATLYTAKTLDTEYTYVFITDPGGQWIYVLSAQVNPHSPLAASTTADIKTMIDSFQKTP